MVQGGRKITLDQLFAAIEREKMRSLDESRSPLERTQSMRVRPVRQPETTPLFPPCCLLSTL